MALNKNIFYATNPALLKEALWKLISASGVPLPDMLIFLPSRRSVRSVEKMLVEKSGGALILPHLVALGEGVEEVEDEIRETSDVISNTERLVVLTKLLSEDKTIGNIATALPIAHDLIRMTDYLENEGVDVAQIDWSGLVDEKYAVHFQHKARLLDILSEFVREYNKGRITETQRRNRDIRNWISELENYKLVVVCGSTASVPATADLMRAVAKSKNGKIILSGKIQGRPQDFELATNPYNAEYKFLKSLGADFGKIIPIDVGNSAVDFLNYAFGNETGLPKNPESVSHCNLLECRTESEEANAAVEIAERAIKNGRSVLIITPDKAGNQRLAAKLSARGIVSDFSSGISGSMTPIGRAVLNTFDEFIEKGDSTFEKLYERSNFDLFRTIVNMIDKDLIKSGPDFDFRAPDSLQVLDAIKKMSDCLNKIGFRLSTADARTFIADIISLVSVRGTLNDEAPVVVLGTIESRMQTADVIILTALNDGMFPAKGYENAWLPRALADKIGLPSPNRKVSLMSLDFMNLSCGERVYWLRSEESGSIQTTKSRFLSRVVARKGNFNVKVGDEILAAIRAKDEIDFNPLDYSAPNPPKDWSDVYVTELDFLIHNPYAFYVRHILKLSPLDDYWALPDARAFGNLIHRVIEKAKDFSADKLVSEMDGLACELLGEKSIIFHFWHKRFLEFAPLIESEMNKILSSVAEVGGVAEIGKRKIRARADRIWDGGVMDIKTGAVPNKKQLIEGNMPQLPLEAYMLKNGGFPIKTSERSLNPEMIFLQLKNNDVKAVIYDAITTEQMINAAVDKVKKLVDMYSVGGAPYEYRETNDIKYHIYDDLARKDD